MNWNLPTSQDPPSPSQSAQQWTQITSRCPLTEPPNQNQLEFTAGLQSLPLKRKKKKTHNKEPRGTERESRDKSMCASVFLRTLLFPNTSVATNVGLPSTHDILHIQLLANKKTKKIFYAAKCACMLYAKGRIFSDLGIYFMNNRSGLRPEGSATEQHLYGIKSVERMKEI